MTTMPAARTELPRLAVLLIVGGLVCYVALHLMSVLGDPLVRSPVLDAREIVDLALAIAQGELPREPFYRAPGYAWLLSLLLRAGVSETTLPTLAVLINAMLHLGSAVIVGAIAAELWRSRAAGLLAGALFAAYPVALYFVADVSDTTLGIFLMLSGLRAAQRVLAGPPGRIGVAIECGLLLGLAVLVRPQLVAMACMVLALAVLGAVRGWVATRSSIAGAAGLALPLIAMALINLHLGGVALVMPWQGAHALYASNGPEANGRHNVQTREVSVAGQRGNPTRIEAEMIYSESTGRDALEDIVAYNRFWNDRTVAHVLGNPGQWLRLVGSKAWYLANDFEQYTNRGYAFHVQRMPWIRNSPLGFALLFSLACAAVVLSRPRGKGALVLVGASLALIGILLLTLVGDRYRLPLVPLLAIAAAGVSTAIRPSYGRLMAAVLVAGVVFAISRWPVPEAMRTESLPDDHFQLASAWLNIGSPERALVEAQAGLALQPMRAWGRALACSAAYNAYLASLPARRPDGERLAAASLYCSASVNPQSRLALAVLGVQACDTARAVSLFEDLTAEQDPDIAADACHMLGHLAAPVPDSCQGLVSSGGTLSRALDGTLAVVDPVDAERSRQLVSPDWCPAAASNHNGSD